jgi:hypothetical protein
MGSLAPCVTLWIGPALGPVERACLTTIVSQGHQLTLYCYEEPAGVPAGVVVADAAEILPEGDIRAHFSDHFRYELQRRNAGIWVDADVYLLAPLPSDPPYLFGPPRRTVVGDGRAAATARVAGDR